MPRVAHFEIYTDNPEAVQSFYREIFGWNFQKFEGGPVEYWLITTGPDDQPGINGGVTRPREGQNPGTLNTIAVASLDQTIKAIEQGGGKICVPKMAIPQSRLARLRRRSGGQRFWNHRAGYQCKVIRRI